MRAENLLALGLLFAGCAPSDPPSTRAAIVDGELDTELDAVVAVMRPSGTCSGSLVRVEPDGRGFVLTAAHCVYEGAPPGTYRVLMGDDYTAPDGDWEVVSVYRHAAFENEGTPHDIAVLELAGVPADTPTLRFLSPREDDSTPGRDYLAVGYGYTDAHETMPTTHRKRASVSVHSVGHNRVFSTRIDGNTCGGDSGGALVRMVEGEWTLIGVHQGGGRSVEELPCGPNGTMSAERVANYFDFVMNAIEGTPTGCAYCRQTDPSCLDSHVACGGDEGCREYRTCLADCLWADPACHNACLDAQPEGAALFADTVGECVCTGGCGGACATECSGGYAAMPLPVPDAGPPPTPDAGPASAPTDGGGSGADAGFASPPVEDGCSCRAARTRTAPPYALVPLALGLVFWRRRQRKAQPTSRRRRT